MNKKEKQIATDFLKEKWPEEKRTCEVCGENDWDMCDRLLCSIPVIKNRLLLTGSAYPFIVMFCTNCYNCKQFASIGMGIDGGGKSEA